MRTTIDLPDELFRRTKATAALRGMSLKEFVAAALRDKLARTDPEQEPEESGWRRVFGKARPEHVEELDRVVREEFSRIDEASWR